ncbi:hypothetical protein L249_6551 [Ophiocordyceps polyrhachis-furcata BCC 54312]|uniref:Extracellular membrane protein CFEM domain-containing protein n=1 Tax=Ophiocordyceps polyrhachis-furcata BCC 54312 TaxID=1330021 RepID=A0A367LLI5_9HYPO|nr:hypothetical protein L249_6551 [Ophiocordyceps polyrhachis-furcata BCC 54312]
MKFLSVVVFLGAAFTQAAEQVQNADANNQVGQGGYGNGGGGGGGSGGGRGGGGAGAGAGGAAGGGGGGGGAAVGAAISEDFKKLGKELIRFQGCILDRFWKDTKEVQCEPDSLFDCICSNKDKLNKDVRSTTNSCFGSLMTTPFIKEFGGDVRSTTNSCFGSLMTTPFIKEFGGDIGALGINVICAGYEGGGGDGGSGNEGGGSGNEGGGSGKEGGGSGKEGGKYGGGRIY